MHLWCHNKLKALRSNATPYLIAHTSLFQVCVPVQAATVDVQEFLAFLQGNLAEEAGVIEGVDPRYRWIIDPVDGTVNFSRGIPFWGISIALHFEGKPLVAVVNLPRLGELYTAIKGGTFFTLRIFNFKGSREGAFAEKLFCL